MGMKGIRNGVFVQGFAPNRVQSVTTTFDVGGVLAWSPTTNVSYQFEGAGTLIPIVAGSIRIIPDGTASLTLSAATIVEVMDQ